MLTVVEKVLLLAEVDLLAETPSEDLAVLAAVTHEEEVARGEMIHEAGDAGDAAYLLAEGRVRLERPGGPHVVLSRGAFGTWALLDRAPRTCTASAVEPSRILVLPREAFIEVVADHVQIAQSVLKTLGRRLRADALSDLRNELNRDDISLA